MTDMVNARATANRVSLISATLYQLLAGASGEDFDGLKQGILELAGELASEAGDMVAILKFIQDHGAAMRIVRRAIP